MGTVAATKDNAANAGADGVFFHDAAQADLGLQKISSTAPYSRTFIGG
jgi:hypothetical protein